MTFESSEIATFKVNIYNALNGEFISRNYLIFVPIKDSILKLSSYEMYVNQVFYNYNKFDYDVYVFVL